VTFFPEVRIAVTQIGEPAVDPLIALLQEKNPDVQALGKKLDFKPGVVGFKAAYLLGDLRAKKAVPALIARLHEPPQGDMQRSILISLGQIGDPAGVQAALAVLKDGKQKSEYRQGACQAMMAARNFAAAPVLLGIAKEKGADAKLRSSAAYALGVLGGKAEHAAFAPVAKAEEYQEFRQAMERLEVAKDCTGEPDDCWAKALDDPKITKQEKGAFMLGAAKNRAKALQALLAHIGVQEQVVRLAIIDSVRRLADKGCTECQQKLRELINREEKLTSKIPQYKGLVDEMTVTLAALSRA
jgi:HEAT repeat protein